MITSRNNRGFSSHGNEPSDAAATGDLSRAARRANQAAARPSRGTRTTKASSAPVRPARGGTGKKRSSRSQFMRYANDNRAVQAVYGIITGPYKLLFYGAVALAVVLSIYFPVRDLYIAHRASGILNEQLAIRQKYNDALQKEVDSYLSNEGIEDTARRDFGMVKEGETPINVTGVDENGDPIIHVEQPEGGDASAAGDDAADAGDGEGGDAAGDDGDGDADDDGADAPQQPEAPKEPSNSAEVERAERAVFENSPWYYKVLDALFFFTGTEGQAVVSIGAGGAGEPAGSAEE